MQDTVSDTRKTSSVPPGLAHEGYRKMGRKMKRRRQKEVTMWGYRDFQHWT